MTVVYRWLERIAGIGLHAAAGLVVLAMLGIVFVVTFPSPKALKNTMWPAARIDEYQPMSEAEIIAYLTSLSDKAAAE